VQAGEETNEGTGQHPANDFVYRQFVATLSVLVDLEAQDFAVAE
jgi:hypothetical protein